MDRRTWMYNLPRPGGSFLSELAKFIEAAVNHAASKGTKEICCPCYVCRNMVMFDNEEIVSSHLVEHGFLEDYTIWTEHGEGDSNSREPVTVEGTDGPNTGADDLGAEANDGFDLGGDEDDGFDFEELLRVVEPEVLLSGSARGLDNLETMKMASNNLVYNGCEKEFTVLRTVLELMKLKATHAWSDASFNDLLELLTKILPKPNGLPKNTYFAKKLISPLSLGVEKIHACPKHCILYRGIHKDATSCPRCKRSRYKRNVDYDETETVLNVSGKNKKNKKTLGRKRKKSTLVEVDDDNRKIPALVMWYLPVIDRLRRLFANARDAELLTWHSKQKGDDKIRHPSDGSQWKNFDLNHKEFAGEKRNIRFALSTDGMNPFGEMRNPHSTWPVVLSMYNLPPWLCHKRKYLLLTILISGPKQPTNDIDVFLVPLLEDMKKLWEEGVRMWDEYRRESFTLHAIIFVTINDCPALRALSGQVKGKAACVVCIDETDSAFLPYSQKTVYMGHRRFLPRKHKYRFMAKYFNGKKEERCAPRRCTSAVVYGMVKNIDIQYGKPVKGAPMSKIPKDIPFKKKSIFYVYLNYWKELEVTHAIDWMHVGKGVADSTIGLALDLPGKTKDGLRARRDLQHMEIRPELHPQETANGKFYLPAASYNLTQEEKIKFCRCLRGIKVPTGFSSNMKNLVNMEDLKISGYNTSDCHAMLSVFLPVAIRAIKPEYVKLVITRLCYFFNAVGKKVISLDELNDLRQHIKETMCMLEMCFPPSYFDTMEHFMIHIVDQIFILGPVYLHHMFPFERYMYVLKRYVRTRSHPEGSMIEGYTTEEIIECCLDYIDGGRSSIGLPVSRHEGRLCGKGIMGRKSIVDQQYKEVEEAHFNVLHQVQVAEKYIDEHIALLERQNPKESSEWIAKEHKRSFTTWLMKLDMPSGMTPEEQMMKRLASRPSRMYVTWQSYDINGFTFHTKQKDNKSTCQNSGVRTQAYDSKGTMTSYYGYIEEIWELDYGENLQVPIFRCRWVKHPNGVEVDDYGITIVDLNNVGHKDQPWILAKSVEQVFYILDPKDEKKYIVVPGKQRIVGVEGVEDPDEYNQYDEMPFFVDPERLKLLQARLSYSTTPPYLRTDCEGKIVQG